MMIGIQLGIVNMEKDILLRNSQVRDLEIELQLSSIIKVRTRKRVMMRYPGEDIDVIKDRLDVEHGSRGVIILEIGMERLKGQRYY